MASKEGKLLTQIAETLLEEAATSINIKLEDSEVIDTIFPGDYFERLASFGFSFKEKIEEIDIIIQNWVKCGA